MTKRPLRTGIIICAVFLNFPAFCETKFAAIFQDNMVLQRDVPVPIWGWSDAAEVQVDFAGQQIKSKTDQSGYWKVVLKPLAVSNEGRILTLHTGDKDLSLANVVVGEVWIAAGQSNMNHSGPNDVTGVYSQYPFNAEAGLPDVRIIRFGEGASLEPLDDITPLKPGPNPWRIVKSGEIIKSLNIPTGFACILRDRLKVPVGIIHVAVSGTNQGTWIERKTLECFEGQGDHRNYYDVLFANYNNSLAKRGKTIKSWKDFERVMAQWRKEPKGRSPLDLSIYHFPSVLYNTRIHPLGQFALKGVIWHQGEGGPGGPYGKRLVAMIQQWRKQFGQEFAFVWGTLSRNTTVQPPIEPKPNSFYRSKTNREISSALNGFSEDKNVALVELYDLGNHDTHFLQKGEAAKRMGLAALSAAYGKKELFSGPLKRNIRIEGGKAVVKFDRVGDGIVYKPSINGISGFYIKDKGSDYHWADVKVTGKDTIELSHPEIPEISGIGYAVNANPLETLFNSEGYPASPFRTVMYDIPHAGRNDGTPLISLDKSTSSKPGISTTHLRRDGYIFQLIGKRGSPKNAAATVSAYIPAEWKEYVVESGATAITGSEKNENGRRFISFTVPVDKAWIIVCRKANVEEFRKINRY